jgi:AraC-like DNA-binding protein
MYSFGPQSLIILSPQAKHSVYVDRECYGINILISKSFFHKNENELSYLSHDNYLSRLSNKTSYVSIDTSPFSAASSLFEMISEFQYKTTPSFSAENSYLKKILEHILFALHFAITEQVLLPVFENDISTSQEYSADKIFDYIKNNLADVSLESTAKHFGYSAMSIHRMIKAQTGSSFTVYVSKQRINLAKFLLKKTNLPISEIASQLGCGTSDYFCKFFKKHADQTPSHYRKEYYKTHTEDITS